jgi:hypothetical protein
MIEAFIIGILSSLAVAGLLKYRLLFTLFPKITRRGYNLDLAKKIRQMPFIYKDLDTDVINDFVGIEFQSLHLATLQHQNAANSFHSIEDEKLVRNKKVLLLGSAGIGKTTFQRRSILTIIENVESPPFLYEKERPVPLYVPLKAIDNSEPFPIFRYVIANNPLFMYKYGLGRFRRLAASGDLFLFLDGYDEIPFTGGTRNFVQEELSMLFVDPGKDDRYLALRRCRVWLSSRKEFFEKNPITDLEFKVQVPEEGVAAIELKGIGNNRIKLVRKIFDKYRLRSPKYYEFLDEELLLHQIDGSDDEIRDLSFNPLFLTVMCYIYAQKAIEKENHSVEWAKRFDDLIIECISLLLQDLDKNKARDLPKARIEALLTRRDLFVEAKKLFLQYFSMQLYFDNKPVFTLPYIKEQMRNFFDSEVDISAATDIIRNLDLDDSSKPNVALQLIYQGVFVLVDSTRDESLYDFPHRRFREILASRYINTPERYERLLADSGRKDFGEFLNVFYKSDSYRDRQFHDATLELVLQKALGHTSDDSFVQITSEFTKHKPEGYDVTKAVTQFLTAAVLNVKEFRVSKALLRDFDGSEEFLKTIETEVVRSATHRNLSRFSICLSVLHRLQKLKLVSILQPMLGESIADREFLPVILRYLTLVDIDNLLPCLRSMEVMCRSRTDSGSVTDPKSSLNFSSIDSAEPISIDYVEDVYLDFCYAISFNLRNDDYWFEFMSGPRSAFLRDLTLLHQVVFFYMIYKVCPARYGPLQERLRFPIGEELFEFVEHHPERLSLNAQATDTVFIIRDEPIAKLNEFFRSRRTAFLESRMFKYSDKDNRPKGEPQQERRYAPIPVTDGFKQSLFGSLESLQFQIVTRDELDAFFQESVTDATEKMRLEELEYLKFDDLPAEIKSSILDDMTLRAFRLQLRDIIESGTAYNFGHLSNLIEVVGEIDYAFPTLIDHFE